MNIIKAGLAMLIYFFIVAITYFIISTPVTTLLDGFEGSHAEVDSRLDLFKGYFTLFIALSCAVPITWFLFWVFHREPDWSYRRYY